MRNGAISNQMKLAASQNIKERDYWLNKLSGHLVRSFFPYDRQSKVGDERRLDMVNFQFSEEPGSMLLRLSNKSDNRLHMIFTAGLVALLNKYTGNKSIIVGMPIKKQEIEGEFINTVLPLLNKLETNMTFKQLILQVRQTIIEAAQHQNYPMENLLQKLNIPSSQTTEFTLFDVAILLENIHDKSYLGNINYNMLFSFSRAGESIEGTLEYNASLYERTTIKRIAIHYQQLFKSFFPNPDIALVDIDILPEVERRRILLDFNDTDVEYPKDKTIHALLEVQVEKTPDKIALIYNHQCLTYRVLNEKANRLARFLRKKGVRRESILGIIMEPSLELIIGIVGILKSGAAYLPIDVEYPAKRISSILRDSDASILLTKEKIMNAVAFTTLKDIKIGKVTPVVTASRSQVKDFDSLPFPDRTLIEYGKYHRYIGIAMARHTVSLQATRGCPFNCAFCHKIWPKSHVFRSAENIFEEIMACYNAGARRFTFVDDVFNLKKDNAARLMEKIIKNRLDIQLFFSNGLRGDILNKEAIDLMVEAGTVNVDLALESASPRIQKLINKNLDLEAFRDIVRYFTEKYPQVLLEIELVIGFPTETEEEALMTLEFLENLKWVHFPNLHILKIYPNTDMYRLAIENGISLEQLERSTNLAYHQLPETLPYSKSFAGQIQMRFMNEYFLSRERLLHVLPLQVKTLTKEELIQKYDNYLPMKIRDFPDILNTGRIAREELSHLEFLPADHMAAPGFQENMMKYFPPPAPEYGDSLRVLLLDLSQLFSADSESTLHDTIEEPLGLIYLLTYLKKTFGRKIRGKIGKSRMEFDSYEQMKTFIREFNPDIIGIRTLSYYKEFLHRSVSLIRQWGIDIPIIAGGPYATSDYQLVLNDPNIDLVVLGEGELTVAQLMEKVMENGKKLPDDEILKNIPGLAFVKQQDKTLIRETGREVVFLDNIEEVVAAYPGENLDHINQPGDLLYLISTSGSTGVPKSLMIEHRNMVNLLNFQFHETAVDFKRVLQFASIGFDASFQEIFSTLLSGGELHLISLGLKHDMYRLLELMGRNHLNVLYCPPAFLKYVFSEPTYRNRFPKSLQHIIPAGEQLIITGPIREHIKKNHVYVHNHYGPAETHVVTTFTIDPAGNIPKLPPIGKPISNTRIYILDENKKIKPIGAIGELYISGANVGRGYYRREELTAEKFTANPFVEGERMYLSGDLARWLPDGNIEFIGRSDFQVKIRAFRIELGEIETRLTEIDFIKEAVVVDYNDPAGEKYLCAYVVSQKEVHISEIKDILANDLPDYMVPSYFVQLEKIPVTTHGKVDKKALPMPEFKADETYTAPRDNLEKALTGIWADVLGIEKVVISIDDNFFDLGGHSLKATILITRIHQTFNVKMTLGEMFKQPTIRGLSQLIKESGGDIFLAIQPVEKKEYYPLSSAQMRMYILQRMNTDNTSYNNPSALILEVDLDKEKFNEILKRLVKRHEALRMSFQMIEEQAVQRVHENVEFAVKYDEMTEEEAVKTISKFVRPFDLSRTPLMRVGLIKIAESQYILMYDLHHIITDGTSMQVFVKEFMALYGGKHLPPLKVHYKDFSQWQNRLFLSGKIKKQQEYWLKQLEGEIPVLNLPTDYPRSEIQRFEGDTLQFEIGSERTRALNHLAKEHNATLYMVLLASFNILLTKLSGQEDIIIGSPIAGRRHADLHFTMGMFVNTLVTRNYPIGTKTFRDFLDDVRDRTLAGFGNQDYPFETLVEQIAVNRDISRNPLFDVMFILQNMTVQSGTIPEVDIPGLSLKPFKSKLDPVVKFDMTLSAIETGDSLALIVDYSTCLFKKETIQRFISYFNRITGDILQNAGKKISDIEILLPTEKDRLLFEFNRTGSDYPKDKTLHQLFEEQVERTPDRIGVLQKKNIFLTYKKLNEQSGQLGQELKEKGVQADTIVGIRLERSLEMIIGIYGILKAGGAYLPIDPNYPQERIRYMLADSKVQFLLTDNPSRHFDCQLSIVNCQLSMDEETQPSTLPSTCQVSPANLVYVIYTSGSTGVPKGVTVEHGAVVNVLAALQKKYPLKESDTYLLKTSYLFDVSVAELFGWFFEGGRLAILEKNGEKLPNTILDTIEYANITHTNFVPSMFQLFVEELTPRNISKLSGLKYIFLAGEALLLEPVEKFMRLNKNTAVIALENIYGPTEGTIYSSWYSLVHWQGSRSIPIGKPLPNVRLYILDQYGGLQPTGVPGELCIAGAGLARGYLNNPEMTNSKFQIPNYKQISIPKLQITNKKETNPPKHPVTPSPYHPIYRTGDLARWLNDGNIEFFGRMDFQVKIRGFRIELGEIENQLLKHDEIKNAVVTIRKDKTPVGGYCLCAYIVGSRDFEIVELREYLAHRLPDYMIPAYFVNLDEIQLTPQHKVDRRALPEPELKAGGEYVAPGNEVEVKMVELWSEVLGVEKEIIGINRNFFELGGQSLKATVLISKIHRVFDVKVPLVEVFKTPTVRRLAEYIREAEKDRYASIEPMEKKEYYPLSSAQQRLYILQQMDMDSTAYNMPYHLTLPDNIDIGKLEKILLKLVERHESLRTSFLIVNDEPVQKIHHEVKLAIQFYRYCKPAGMEVEKEAAERNLPAPDLNIELERISRDLVKPFDLSQAPLLRMVLVEVERKNFPPILFLDMHHIITDGTSQDILKKEFIALDTGEELPPLGTQYKDYVGWMKSSKQQELMKQQETYWLNLFTDELPLLNLHTDYPRPAVQSFEGQSIDLMLDREETEKLNQLVKKEDATMFITLISILYVLLSKICRQEDIIIGTAIAGRRHADIQNIVGFLVNTLALRNFPTGEKTFIGFLREVKKRTITAFENQEYQFEELVDQLLEKRDPARNPIFDIMFVLHNQDDNPSMDSDSQEMDMPGDEQENQHRRSLFDLLINAFERGTRLMLSFEYNTKLFKEKTIKKFMQYYKNILTAILQDNDIKLKDIKISHDLPVTGKKNIRIDFDF
jgi:amino acid adenylation domain-containing protein